jgi:cytochrome P450
MSDTIQDAPGISAHELFDRAAGLYTMRDPYPELGELRARGAVHRFDLAKRYPILAGAVETPSYIVVTHDLVTRVLSDPETFSSSAYSYKEAAGHNILQMDGEEHARYRGLVQRAFTRRSLDAWTEKVFEPIVQHYIDGFAGRGAADLIREFTFRFPIHVIARMFGLPEDDLEALHDWSSGIFLAPVARERAMGCAGELIAYLQPIMAQRRRGPEDDLLSLLAAVELDGERLSDEEILAFVMVMIPAGGETTYRATSNLLYGLLTHPDQLEALRERPERIPQAVEEGLRWEGPITAILRFAVRDSVLDGVEIPAGTHVVLSLGAANRDAARYENPDVFDLFRKSHANLAFGWGPHRCLGMHLGRAETEIAIRELLHRLPGLCLDPAAEDVHIAGDHFRSPRCLPVLFDAEAD